MDNSGNLLSMKWFVVKVLINAGALFLVSRLISGFQVETVWAAITAGLILGLVNAIIRPFLVILTLPVNLITLGLFTFIINAALLLLVANFVNGFEISGFASALLGAIILWLVSLITNTLLHTGR